jgi:hypothetical protein
MIREAARATEILSEHDVVVLGGGPAGIAAATAAARHGADVLLVERYGFLGGMGTAGGVTNFAGLYALAHGETRQVVHGIVDDLLARIDRLGGLNKPQQGLQGRITVRSYDVSAYKCAADDLLLSCGVKLLFHALAVEAAMEAGAIEALIVETKSGRRAVRARIFIDASGDADLAAHAGVPFETGDGHGSGLFPTMMFRVGGVDPEKALAAIGEFKTIDRLMQDAAATGAYRFPREGAIVRPQKNPTEWRVNVTQIRNAQGRAMDATDALELSAGEVEGRRQVQEYFRFLKNERLRAFEHCRDRATGRHPGDSSRGRTLSPFRRRHPGLHRLWRCDRRQCLADGAARRRQGRVALLSRQQPRLLSAARSHARPAQRVEPPRRGALRLDDP